LHGKPGKYQLEDLLKYAFQRKNLFTIILFCAAAGILIAPASADVISWDLSPACPSAGDNITISGKAASNEIIDISILHEEMVPVSGKNYIYQMNKLTIPESVSGENSFEVSATGEDGIVVKDMHIRVKKFKWISRHANAKDGTATISQSNVPSWMSYFVKIDGDIISRKEVSEKNKDKSNSNNGQVKLIFETSYEAAKADSKGNFTCSYDTDSLPAGNYTINVGGIAKEFILNPEKEKEIQVKELKVKKKVKGL
jgi:hypothetical protein